MKLNMDPEKLYKKIKRAKKTASRKRVPFWYKKMKIEGVLRNLSAIEAASGTSTETAKVRKELIGALLKGEEKRRYSRVKVLHYAYRNSYDEENIRKIKELYNSVKINLKNLREIYELYKKENEWGYKDHLQEVFKGLAKSYFLNLNEQEDNCKYVDKSSKYYIYGTILFWTVATLLYSSKSNGMDQQSLSIVLTAESMLILIGIRAEVKLSKIKESKEKVNKMLEETKQ